MAVTDVSILKKKRQQKKAARLMKKLLIILAAAAVVLAIILTKELWYPKLNGILSKVPVTENTAELAGGHFPIAIDGGADYQLETMDNAIAVLDDSHFFAYNNDGKLLYSEQHTLSKPIMTVSGKKALIYDLGGTTFSLISKYKNIYSKTTDSAILIAKLSSNDYAAVVTMNDKFMSMLMIYDNNGRNIFNYGSIERIIDITFDSGNNGCYITTVGSYDGVLASKILYYKFDQVDYDALGDPVPVWETEYIETLAISVRLFGSGNIIVFGDTMCAYYDINGNLINSYEYDHPLSDYDSRGSIAALIFSNKERRSSDMVIIDCITGGISKTVLDYNAENLQVSDNQIYVHSRNEIRSYSSLGEPLSSVDLESEYDDFCRVNNYIFLMGYDQINRIDFN